MGRNRPTAAGLIALVFLCLPAASARASGFYWPVSGMMTSTWYTWRGDHYHKAIDIAAPTGTFVGAAQRGTVTTRSWYGAYGYLVVVSHVSGYQTWYGHNSRYGASGSVALGTIIAYVGSTGNSTGPHSHFEIRRYGTILYIPGSYGTRTVRGQRVPYNYPGI